MDILKKLNIFTLDDSTCTGDIAVNKGIPKKDGSGKGIRANKNRGKKKKKKKEKSLSKYIKRMGGDFWN